MTSSGYRGLLTHRSAEAVARRRGGQTPRLPEPSVPPCISLIDVPVPALVVDDASGRIVSMNPIASDLFGVTGLELNSMPLVDLLGTEFTPATGPRGQTSFGHLSLSRRGEFEVVIGDAMRAPRSGRLNSVVMLVPSIGQQNGPNSRSRVVGWEDVAEQCSTLAPDLLCVAIGVVGLPAVNADFSRSTGDFAIGEIHRRLRLAVGNGGIAERIGGGRFLALMPCSGDNQLSVERLVDAVRRPITAPLGDVVVGCAAGATLGRSRTPLVLFDRAVRNLEHALDRGAGSTEWSGPFRQPRTAPARLAAQLSVAVAKREIGAVFQPVVSVFSGEIVEYEALARWPENGDVGPVSMVALAKDIGILDDLRASVLASVIEVLKRGFHDYGGGERRVSVNVGSIELASTCLVETLVSVVEDSGIRPSCLRLEITDAVPREDLLSVKNTIDSLRAHGIRVALDGLRDGAVDWLSLVTLDVDAIKIEADLLVGAQHNGRTAAALRSILDLALELGVDVIAKGVETLDQHEQLVSAGCGLAQGRLYSQPQSADDIGSIDAHTVDSATRTAGCRVPGTGVVPCSPPYGRRPATFRSGLAAKQPIVAVTADLGDVFDDHTCGAPTERALT